MKKVNATEMRAVEGGATYYYTEYCPECGTKITGKASGWKIFASFLKVKAKNDFYAKLDSHLSDVHGW